METKILKIKNFYYRYRKYILINFAIVSLILMVCLIAYFLRSKQDQDQDKTIIYYNVASAKIDSFDPQKAVFNQDSVVNMRFYNLIHEGLTKKDINNNKNFICNLVEDNPVLLSDNGYKFKLKSNIKFHNGKILKPSDVKFTIQRNHVKHQENGKPSCSVFKKFDMTKSVFDDKTNTMEIYYYKDKYSAELDMLKDLAFVKILNEETCSKDNSKGAQIGLGHYKIKTFSDAENNILLDKFVDFFDTTRSNEFPENIRVRLFESNQIDTMIEEVESNQIHALLDCPSDKIQKVTDKTNIEFESNVKPFSLSVLWFNCAKIRPEVRKLIAKTINTKKMVEEIRQDDETVKLDEYLFPNSFIYNDNLIGYEQQQNTPYYINDISQIKNQVSQLNPEDKKIIIATFKPSEGSFRSRFFHKIKDSLDAVGFEVDFTYKSSFPELDQECKNNENKCKAVIFGESLDDTDPSPTFAYYSVGSHYKEVFNLENQDFQKIFDTLLTVNIPDGFPNLTQKTDKIKELNKILKDEIPCLPLIANKNNYTLYNRTNAKFKALRDILSH